MSILYRAVPLAILALVGSTPARADSLGLTPRQIGEIFCIARSADDMAPVMGIATEALRAAIAEALAQNEAIAAAYPDEKPPLGDGIPWQGYPDRADSCAPGDVVWQMDEARLPLHYGFDNAPDAAFTDTLVLRLQPWTDGRKTWRLDDISYSVEGNLRSSLLAAFMP